MDIENEEVKENERDKKPMTFFLLFPFLTFIPQINNPIPNTALRNVIQNQDSTNVVLKDILNPMEHTKVIIKSRPNGIWHQVA